MSQTQLDLVKNHLLIHGSISSWEAITSHHITRLAEYIRQLRDQGFNIISEWQHSNGKRWVVYHLEKKTVEYIEKPVGKQFQVCLPL